MAVSFSAFDETVQLWISNRSFEMGDIAKDTWGTVMGLVLIMVGESRTDTLLTQAGWLRSRHLRGYFENPLSLLTLITAFAMSLLIFSSLLPELKDWATVVLLTFAGFAAFFAVLHLSQFRPAKYAIATIVIGAVAAQSYFFIKHRAEHIVYTGSGLTVYKGVPMYFFDLLIFPDGTFRPAPKKSKFFMRSRAFFLQQEADIILIGSGDHGEGGGGFPQQTVSQFLYNPYTKDGTQVIILKNAEACRLFNKLKSEQKDVLFVLHNTC